MSIHAVKREHTHLAWDNSIKPVLTVASGAEISFDCLDASNGQIDPSSTVEALSKLKFDQLDQVNGPVYVEGAQPGDVLRVDVLDLAPAEWGWTALIPGFGLLADEYPTPALKIWTLETDDQGPFGWFDKEKGIRIPLRPFCGEMGVAPGKSGAFSTIPPYQTGGNLDTKHLTKGATLFLPVEAEGALFSIGDGHAAQGDGEVCGTAIETPMRVTVRLTVLKEHSHVTHPHFSTTMHSHSETYYATTGVGPSMLDSTKDAVRGMIATLKAQHGLSDVQGYMLCSVAGDLKLHEVVDMPNYVVGMMIPQSIFGHSAP